MGLANLKGGVKWFHWHMGVSLDRARSIKENGEAEARAPDVLMPKLAEMIAIESREYRDRASEKAFDC